MKWPKVIAEIGINHNGDYDLALDMIESVNLSGCGCVKFQCHIPREEMVEDARKVIPANADESIYDMMVRCQFTEEDERGLKHRAEYLGMQYLCTPFSRAAADRLERMGVTMYKIGSGECNNYPLIKHINSFGKPIILSTGMNDMDSIARAVDCLTVPFALLHCVSMYPTPYEDVHLGAMLELKRRFDCPVGLSDHSLGIYTALAAVALGADIVEKHFTLSRALPGSDNPISIEPDELRDLVLGSMAIRAALGGTKQVQPGEVKTAEFAYSCVVTLREIRAGEALHSGNIWVKRPGTGEIKAAEYESLFGCVATRDIPANAQVKWSDVCKP